MMRARFRRRLRGITLEASAVGNAGEYCLVGKSVGSVSDRTDTLEQLSSASESERDSGESSESSSVSATVPTRLMVFR